MKNISRGVAQEFTFPKKFVSHGFVPTTDVSSDKQIATKMFTIRADLFPPHYSDTISGKGIKEVATIDLKCCRCQQQFETH
ncbi:MAG: hypothetical protein IPF46_06825 [Saprospiraceae bacterium]|nr:hypothetical protein [Candidatus Vicinibacter affinis]